MHRQGEMLVDNRVVLQFRTRVEVCTNGHHRLFVESLSGVTVEVFDGKDLQDVEHQLSMSGYQRIPPVMADDLDMFRTGVLQAHRIRRPADPY